MTFLETAQVSFFHGSTNATPVRTIPLSMALDMIIQNRYRQALQQLRQLLRSGNKALYDRQKATLDAMTPCGTFHPTRAKATLTQHNGIVHGDLDHLPELAATRQALCSDPYTVYCFVSPSGTGLKIGFRVDPVADDAAYKHAWQAVSDYSHEQYGITWDPSGKDISRLCFMSWDPECYVNENAALFHVPLMVLAPPRPQTPPRPRDIPADRRERYAQQAIETATRIIDASIQATTTSAGTRHATRLKAARLLGGYVASGILDYSEAYTALEAAVQRNTTDFHSAMKDIADGLQHGQKDPLTLENLEAERHQWIQEHRPMPAHSVLSGVTPNGQPPATPGPEDATASGTATAEKGALPYSDYTNAMALVRDHGQDLRYCYPWGKWLCWTDTYWAPQTDGAVMRAAKQTIKRLARHAEDLNDEQAVALLKHVKASLATSKLKAMVESAQSEPGIPVLPENLDTNPWLLNCTNGTLDLKTGTLRPHERTDLLTRCLTIAYDPHAQYTTWERFLWRIMGGTNRDEDTADLGAGELENRLAADASASRLIPFLQRAIGYSLTGNTSEQCLFVLHGSGSNGKSTFLEVLQALMGDYAQSTPSASLLARDRHDRIPNDIARLRGARLVTAVEIGDGKRLDEELVKRLTGQDTLTARFLHAEFFDFKAEFKLFIACNHLPTIKGTDHAIWRRIKLVPFTVSIPESEQDKDFPTKLSAELPGILRWAVQGCLEWQKHGLGTPNEVKEATAGYRASMDVLGTFLADRCILAPYAKSKASRLYKEYQDWCQDNGEHALVQRDFGMRLSERGIEHKREGTGYFWHGIGIPQSDDSQ